MLTQLDPASLLAIGLLIFALIMVMIFEATNGFHDAANAVATVIYTRSLSPVQAVVWSGAMNFVGVLVGGIAVAYALVELLPAEVLSPPDGGPAVAMLIALFVSALTWNLVTWWFALPNSSSHCLIGALIGVALGNALVHAHHLAQDVHWQQLRTVIEALALSPLLGFVLAALLYLFTRRNLKDPHLYERAGEHPPVWWMRGVLILTCTGVSFAHGTNDGQKNIGMMMLAVIGLFPAAFALNPQASNAIAHVPEIVRQARPLIEQYDHERRDESLQAAERIVRNGTPHLASLGSADVTRASRMELGLSSETAQARSGLRADIYRVISGLARVQDAHEAGKDVKNQAKKLGRELGTTVEYAPWWIRILSAVCLGFGTMIGYRRIVTTLGERLGHVHLTPAQGASAEVVSAAVIGLAGFTGMPVSTTHIVTSGIGGTMVASGAGLRFGMLYRILMAWLLTLPVTILVAGALYYLLADPRFQ